jgi:hypothetical protein
MGCNTVHSLEDSFIESVVPNIEQTIEIKSKENGKCFIL